MCFVVFLFEFYGGLKIPGLIIVCDLSQNAPQTKCHGIKPVLSTHLLSKGIFPIKSDISKRINKNMSNKVI